MVPFAGPPEYGEWVGTESDARAALQGVKRALGARCYCEMKPITCAECDIEEAARVICTL